MEKTLTVRPIVHKVRFSRRDLMTGTCPEQPWYETVVIPALLRHARSAYGVAMRKALAEIGCDDMPRNGMYVIGGMAMGAGGLPLGQLVRELGVSRQSAQQLVDALVERGYVERVDDAEDPHKAGAMLTPRGKQAAATQAEAREQVDAALTARVGEDCVKQMRIALGALCAMGLQEADEASEH
jgi:DNA-binding MarR family transcriptional regulator